MNMEISRQSQSAGDNSQQFQLGNVTNLTIVNGISEQRAREIFQEMNRQTIAKYTQDARDEAFRRIGVLENQIMKRAQEVNGVLEAFSDPAFQILLAEAQKRAAATERKADYALLSELLVAHVQKGSQRTKRAGINRAIEIVDDIDTQALCALTVIHAAGFYVPKSGNISIGLDTLDQMFGKLMHDELPETDEWLDHLDTLGAIRISSYLKMKTTFEYFIDRLSGYACAGIKLHSPEYSQAVKILTDVGIHQDTLVANECLEGYVRIETRAKNAINEMFITRNDESIPLTNAQISAIEQVFSFYSNDQTLIDRAKKNFMDKWGSYKHLHTLQKWWDGIGSAFQITQVGKILAHINEKRCDPSLPDLI